MSPSNAQPEPAPSLAERALGPLAHRPRLLGGMIVSLAAGLVLFVVPNPLHAPTRVGLAWDAGLAWFITSCLIMMRRCSQAEIEARAAREDEGQHIILGLAVAAAAASLVAIGFELSVAKGELGLGKGLHTALAFTTVFASWFFVQLVFSLHYAHAFYGEADGAGGRRGGLAFPGEDDPDYWDFLHFGVIIGVANQTADVAFTSRELRHIGTVHGMVSFLFNTVILALTINLLAGLF